ARSRGHAPNSSSAIRASSPASSCNGLGCLRTGRTLDFQRQARRSQTLGLGFPLHGFAIDNGACSLGSGIVPALDRSRLRFEHPFRERWIAHLNLPEKTKKAGESPTFLFS